MLKICFTVEMVQYSAFLDSTAQLVKKSTLAKAHVRLHKNLNLNASWLERVLFLATSSPGVVSATCLPRVPASILIERLAVINSMNRNLLAREDVSFPRPSTWYIPDEYP